LKLSGKGIYVYTDPAAENSILALVDELILEGKVCKKDFLVVTNHIKKSKSNYKDIVDIVDSSIINITNVLRSFKPQYIFCGTSLNKFEFLWRKAAKNENIKTISFIDHWTSYVKRFSFNNEIIFGDEILVLNEIAKEEAIEAGIPENLINIFENPYYKKVKNFNPEINKESFFRLLNLDISKKTILYISDDIKRSFSENVNGECILGFDEYSVLKDIIICLNKLEKKVDFSSFQLVIKLHPRSVLKKFNKLISKKPKALKIHVLKDCDSLTINYYSEIVIGMFSNMVIESYLLGKNPVRAQIGGKWDPFKFNDLKIKPINNRVNLLNKIEQLLRTE
jgi:predicted glycosyltransferase